MSIRRLRTLIAIADTGSFAEAAGVVHVSQAAVGQQMKALEEELRVTLFDRGRRPPELNQQGRALTAKARDVVGAYDDMIRSLEGEGPLSGQLMIGAVPTTLGGLVPKTIATLKTAYPDLQVKIMPGLSAELMPQVDRGYLDAAVISAPDALPNHMNWQPFVSEPLVLLAPAEAEGRDPVELLRTCPYIRFSRRAWVGGMIDRWLERNRISVDESMELDTLDAIAVNVFHGLGVSIVPSHTVPSPNPLPLARIPLGKDAEPRVLGVLSRKDNVKLALTEALLSGLRSTVGSAQDEIPNN
ncbi:MAG: LysR family transcriptional regulator [Pseudomonadota bacterium]